MYIQFTCDGFILSDIFLQNGHTPLHEAAYSGHMQSSLLLMEARARRDIKSSVRTSGMYCIYNTLFDTNFELKYTCAAVFVLPVVLVGRTNCCRDS